MKLGEFWPNFVDSGYEDYEYILWQMMSRHPITDYTLRQDINIAKPGYRARLLGRLHDDVAIKATNISDISIDVAGKNTACEMCVLM
jgi:hypothetical protein